MRFFLALLALFATLLAPFSHAEEDLLEPEKAFLYSARMVDEKQAEVTFAIADGYYLYKDKIKFSAEDGVKLGRAQMPKAKSKQDEYFGKVEYYRKEVRVLLPVSYAGKARPFKLHAQFQGCADVGVCYPPQQAVADLNPSGIVPVVATNMATTTAPEPLAQQNPAVLARLKNLAADMVGGGGNDGFLSPDEAFQAAVSSQADGSVKLHFTVAPGHYLYRDKVKLVVSEPAGVTVSGIDFPKAEEKNDPNFGRMLVYHQDFDAIAHLAGVPAGTTKLAVLVNYQGCSEKGICYPPEEKPFNLAWSAPANAAAVASAARAAAAPAAPAVSVSESDDVTSLLKGGSFWVIVASFFGFGLLLALTPCVFPMIPILSGIIVGQGDKLTKTHGFLLSLAYVLGMALTYAMAGVAAGLSGTLISNALQNPWALGTGAAIFVALSLSMFGFYELQMPSFLQSRVTEASNKIHGGHFFSVFIMGALSALIVGPCVAAPLAGALLYISQTSDVVLGGVSLFFLALGMGVPLLLVGLSAGALLPKAGGWMEGVKRIFGFMLLAVAIWLISPVIPALAQMLLWATLLIVAAMFLHALDTLPTNVHGARRLGKGLGLIALVAGIALLLGALGGSRDVLQPLTIFKGGVGAVAEDSKKLSFTRVKSVAELDSAIQGAAGKHVMLDFYADWCVSCKEMEHNTFTDAKVQDCLKNVTLLQADVTGNSADDKALLARFKLFGPPGIVFFDKTGGELPSRVVGYQPPEKFVQSLGTVSTDQLCS